jgi:hypothetical protein
LGSSARDDDDDDDGGGGGGGDDDDDDDNNNNNVCVCARVCACIKETSQGFCIPAGRHGLY